MGAYSKGRSMKQGAFNSIRNHPGRGILSMGGIDYKDETCMGIDQDMWSYVERFSGNYDGLRVTIARFGDELG